MGYSVKIRKRMVIDGIIWAVGSVARRSSSGGIPPVAISGASETEGPANPLLEKLEGFRAYLIESGLEQSTAQTYAVRARHFLNWLGHRPLNTASVSSYQDYLIVDARFQPASIMQRRYALGWLCRWLISLKEIRDNPAQRVKWIEWETELAEPDLLTREELIRFRQAVFDGGDLRHIAMVETLLCTGVRAAELLAIRYPEDIMPTQGGHRLMVRAGKGIKHRRIDLTSSTFEVIEAWALSRPLPGGKLFAMTPVGLAKMLRKYAEDAHISKRVYPTLLRRQFATELFSKGVDLATIQKLLGHSDINTTMAYVRPAREDMKRAVDGLFDDTRPQ